VTKRAVEETQWAGRVKSAFVLAFVSAALLLVLTAVVSLALFREEGRGQQVNVMELQKAGLNPGEEA
jgi:UPF0716 family protein affecting phage T7 exclusion